MPMHTTNSRAGHRQGRELPTPSFEGGSDQEAKRDATRAPSSRVRHEARVVGLAHVLEGPADAHVAGIPCLGLIGGPAFVQSEAFSFQITTDDQEKTDRL